MKISRAPVWANGFPGGRGAGAPRAAQGRVREAEPPKGPAGHGSGSRNPREAFRGRFRSGSGEAATGPPTGGAFPAWGGSEGRSPQRKPRGWFGGSRYRPLPERRKTPQTIIKSFKSLEDAYNIPPLESPLTSKSEYHSPRPAIRSAPNLSKL